MTKRLPPQLEEFYSPFNWDNTKLWRLPVPDQTVDVAALEWHLDIPIWSSSKGEMLFDLHPRAVIQNPRLYPYHDMRLEEADLAFPLDQMETGGRLVILDSVHRLAKAVKRQIPQIQIRVIPRECVLLFAVDE